MPNISCNLIVERHGMQSGIVSLVHGIALQVQPIVMRTVK